MNTKCVLLIIMITNEVFQNRIFEKYNGFAYISLRPYTTCPIPMGHQQKDKTLKKN